ncbi:MAG: hypothetical protein WCE62_16600, partial [Polyangiales bacterium]
RDYVDAHRELGLDDRYTTFDPFAMVIDLILVKRVEVVAAGRCPPERCESLSDHLPVFAQVRGLLGD